MSLLCYCRNGNDAITSWLLTVAGGTTEAELLVMFKEKLNASSKPSTKGLVVGCKLQQQEVLPNLFFVVVVFLYAERSSEPD